MHKQLDGWLASKLGGFSLIEVLVALAVLSVGLLGLAAMQTTSLKFNHQSYERTQATILSYEILDRIRANPTGNYVLLQTGTPPTPTTDCYTLICNADDMAEYDHSQWITSINSTLAVGQGSITVSSINTNRFVIRVFWDEGGVTRTQRVEAEL